MLTAVTACPRPDAVAATPVAIGNNSVADQPNTVSVGAPGAERRLTNVAPGIQPTDAVNMSQLNDVQRRAYAGVAMSVALSSSKAPLLEPGDMAVGAGVGYYGGNVSLAVTFQGLDSSGKFGYNIGVSTTSKDWTIGAGVSMRWK